MDPYATTSIDSSFTGSADPSVTSTLSPEQAVLFLAIYFIILAVAYVIGSILAGKILRKAGQPFGIGFVPVYNTWKLFEITGRPGWWSLLLLVPGLNLVITILFALDLAKSFGKSQTFAIVGLWLFTVVGLIILAFDKSTYLGPLAGTSGGNVSGGGSAGGYGPQAPTQPQYPQTPAAAQVQPQPATYGQPAGIVQPQAPVAEPASPQNPTQTPGV